MKYVLYCFFKIWIILSWEMYFVFVKGFDKRLWICIRFIVLLWVLILIIFVWFLLEYLVCGEYLVNSSRDWYKNSNYVVNFLCGNFNFFVFRVGVLELVSNYKSSVFFYIFILFWIDLLVFLGVFRILFLYIDFFIN